MNKALHILLVEDSPSDAALLEEALTQSGIGVFKLTHVESLGEGISRLHNTDQFDVLMLDLTLPDSEGEQTFRRAREAAPNLPIVVMTSVHDETMGLEAVRSGIQDYLIKGQAFGRQTARAIRFAIQRKQTEDALRDAEGALEQMCDELELRVQQRTTELSLANEALQIEIRHRQQAEDAHQAVLRRLSEAEEAERGRISRELHDQLGQDLTALKLGLQLLRKQGQLDAGARQSVSRLEKLAEDVMRDMHRLAWELRPSSLDDLGLELAMRRYISQWSDTSHVPVDCHSNLDAAGTRLPLEHETVLYRVTQEALTNVVRHAAATRVSVLLQRRPAEVSLIIEDNGRGFDAGAVIQTAATQAKLGLLGMKERVTLVCGSLEIESTPEAGTTVFVRLPLDSEPLAASSSGHHEKTAHPAG